MDPLDTKSSKTTIDPLINQKCRLRLLYMPTMRSVGIGLVSFFACTALGLAAADFKIRYNQKFPCLEVMDSSAVKITDVTEGAKGETVTSGKSSLNISFIKNSSGQPEVTLREAKSPLSEMEIEAFGLSVGMKPEGTVLVRFGADNKPKFEMDRTGGSRFLMADLGNLDTAAGKEVAGALATKGSGAEPSKALVRLRERFAAWKEGKGGWSNKSGKILKTSGEDSLQIANSGTRKLLEGEAVQVGGTIVVGPKDPMIFQSAAGVYHQAFPGTEITFASLEKDSVDIKVELRRGTLVTYVANPLVAPRANLIVIGEGIVARTGDGLYQVTKGADGKSLISVVSGKVVLADVAGGVERGSASANQKLAFPGSDKASALAAGTPEAATLKAFPEVCKEATLLDIAQDGVGGCPEAIEEILTQVITTRPDLKETIASQLVEIRPDLLADIQRITGMENLKAPAGTSSIAGQFIKRAAGWLQGEPSPFSKAGKVLRVVGSATANGQPIKLGENLPVGASIKTGSRSLVLFLPASGVLAEVQENSDIFFENSSSQFEKGILQKALTRLKTIQGDVHFAVADGFGEKIQLEVSTPKGLMKAQSTTPGAKSQTQKAAKK